MKIGKICTTLSLFLLLNTVVITTTESIASNGKKETLTSVSTEDSKAGKTIDLQLSSGIKEVLYKLEGATIQDWSTYTGEFDITNEGITTIKIKAYDKAGNISKEVSTDIKIDKTNPEILSNLTYNNEHTKATLRINVLDSLSGIKYISSIDNKNIFSNDHSFEVSQNGIYLISAIDNAGNVSFEGIEVSELNNDKLSSGLKEIKYKLEGATVQDWTTYSESFNITNNGTTILRARAYDMAGNVSDEITTIIKIDKNNPKISNTVAYNGDNTKAMITVNAVDDLSGIKYISSVDKENIFSNNYEFEVSKNGTYLVSAVDVAGNVSFEGIDITGLNNDDAPSGLKEIKYKLEGSTVQDWTTYNGDFNISNEGITIVKARAYDMAGNISDEISLVVKIDKTNPVILENVLYNDDYSKATISITSTDNLSGIKYMTSIDNNQVNSNKLEFEVSKNGAYLVSAVDVAGNITFKGIDILDLANSESSSGISKIEYKLEGATIQDWTIYTDTFKLSNEGTTIVTCKALDNAGNISSEMKLEVKIDKTKPTNSQITIKTIS